MEMEGNKMSKSMALDKERIDGVEQTVQSGWYPDRQNKYNDTDWVRVDGLGCQAGKSVFNCMG